MNESLRELEEAGILIAIHSTACLFAAQKAIETYLTHFQKIGKLPSEATATMVDCKALLCEKFVQREVP
jgi:hypothetical protein